MTPARLAMVGVLLAAGAAHAQTNERIYETLSFRFVTPGARAVGMGKTFVGLGDDATAAYSNPAGLSNILAKEFSIEFQGTDIRHERLVSLEPGGPIQTQTFGDTVSGPSFLSFALPVKRWTFSFFLNSVQDYRESFAFEGRPLPGEDGPEDGAFGTISVQNQQYGLGVSYVLNRFVSVGVSGVVSDLSLASEGRSGTPLNPLNGTNTIDHGARLTAMGGILVKPWRTVSIGASYYGGASFDLETTLYGEFLDGATEEDLAPVTFMGDVVPVRYVVPPRLGLGASWRVRDPFTLVFDADRIWYSRLVSDRFRIVDFQAEYFALSKDDFFVRDVWELHGGAEYRLYRRGVTVAFRAGIFTDPSHSLRFRNSGISTFGSESLDFRFNTVPDRTDVGYTAGLGAMFANRFQIDAAGSTSRGARELVLSFVVRP